MQCLIFHSVCSRQDCSLMELLNRICPDAPYVWNGKGFSLCFSDIVLGFGTNLLTLAIIAAIRATDRSKKDNRSISLLEKIALFIIPILGACTTMFDMGLLLRQELDGYTVVFHQWMFYGSLFVVWVTILLVSRYNYQSAIHCNRVLCLWWIIELFTWIPRLHSAYSSKEGFLCARESFIAILDIGFGILINFIRIQTPISSDSMKDPLLPSKIDQGEDRQRTLGFEQNVWGLLTFKSINPVLECGVKRQLDTTDLLRVPVDMDSSCYYLLQQFWEARQGISSSHPLLKTICYSYGWPYFRLGLLKVINDCLSFVGPVLLNKLIRFLQQGSNGYDGYIFAVALGLTSIFKSFLDTQYSFHLAKLRLKLRSGIMTMIYRKCLSVKLAERSKFSEGEIQTFMSVDADRVVNLCNTIHDMWSLPLQIGVALYLLYEQVKFAFLSGLAITILLIPVNKWIAELISKATKCMMEQKDERIRRTAELLTNIRTLKMYGWEHLFADWLMKTRLLEVKYLSTRKNLDAWCVFFWATTPTLFSLFTFGLYALMGHQLDAATVFTCLALFNNLISPLNSFPWVINGLIDAFISSRRLSNYLSCPEHKSTLLLSNRSTHENMAVVLSDACCTWSSSSDTDRPDLLLKNIELCIPKGYMVVVTGEVGSGKSSLLNLILEEARLVRGSVYLCGCTTYVSQVPWIMSGTIRDNILFGRPYDPRRYSDVLNACALDFDISLMIGGDMACIGGKGITLSGGQRARLALARAVYCGSDIYLLDDVLSAVDAHVACSILNNAILGPLMNHQARVLCTHNVQAISAADMVIEMDKGQVKWVGKPSDLTFSSYLASPSIDKLTISEVKTEDKSLTTYVTTVPELDALNVSGQVQGNIEAEARKEGRVELVVYKHYAEFAGWAIAVFTCLSAVLMQASRNGNDMWLSYWVDTTGTTRMYSTTFYLVILLVFCLVNSSLTLARAFSFAFGGLRAAIRVHDQLLNGIIKAPVSFFDQTPSGRILNRFSSDLYTIDDSLPFILNILLANFVGLLGIVVVLSYVQVIFLVLLLPFGYIYSKLQFYYRSTSRELRRLDSVSRSPIYASFTETLDGASTIRAFKSEEYFLLRFIEHIELYQRTSYSEVTASLWLSLRLQLLAAFIVSFVAVMAVIGSRKHLPLYLGTPGLVGLALSYAAPIVSLLGSFLTSFAETEKQMVSIERVLQYMELPQEDGGDQMLDLNWPSKGEIQFQNVTLRYRPSLPPALHNVSFTVTGGSQVGVIGRTGAGKSSILNAVLRLNAICGGRIFVDGVDIAVVSLGFLRSRFAVVPQCPFLFEGSLRANLDPMQQKEDIEIWNILKKCHVKEEVESLGGGLDIQVKECGTSFSVGQRQLLCLARALLKSSKVIFLDECTASVDTPTASKLQGTIATECRGTTVITIAHRISTVLNVDTVLILDQGNLVEQGNPNVLLQDTSSRFSSFVKASTM